MIRALYRNGSGQISVDLRPEAYADALQDESSVLWVDLASEPPDACGPVLRETFGFHPLAVDDALQESHVPKVDDWGTYLYLVLHAVVFDSQGSEQLHTLELDVFLGENFVVTYQAQPIAAVNRVWTACERDERHLGGGTGHLLYKLADELASDYMPVVEEIDAAIDQIEDQVFGRPGPPALERIFGLKRALLHLRRIIAPQREVLNKLARGDHKVIRDEDRIFFRDVYDHYVGSALDTYLSVVSNRMNEVMKTLTIITTLFMPLSFVVGFFGMNFFQPAVALQGWTGKLAFGLTLLGMACTPAVMYLWMRRRAWL